MADDLAALLEERQRRQGQVTGGYQSVLAQPEQTTTKEEIKRAVTSLLKGSTKGIIDMVGGWGNLYDVIQGSKDPNVLSSRGIINAISQAGGPDLMKIQGYKGMYDVGQAGAPAALMGGITPAGSLFPNVASRGARMAGEFAVGGGLGLMGQQIAPESPYAQLAMQSLPYLVKGGLEGLKTRSQQKLLSQYQKDLPDSDLGIFNQYILRGQGSSDPLVAADIARLTRSPKYLELITALNEGASKAALEGMAPKAGKLTAEESKTGIIQAIQNKLDGIRESNANSLFEKAKGYGGGNGLVDPSITIGKIDDLINRYSAQNTPNAQRALEVLQGIRDRLSPSFTTQGSAGTTVTRAGTPDVNVPGARGYTTTEAGTLSVTIPGSKGFSLTEPGQPARTIPGSPARNVTEQVQVIKYDSLGLPYTTTETRTRNVPGIPSTTVEGTSGVTRNIPSYPGTTLPGTPDVTRTMPSYAGTTLAGTPDVNINIPGAKPFTVNKGPQKLTIEEVQGVLSEFGKKASAGDQLIKDLSISDERIISSAIFGGMKDDVSTALKTATGADKAALNLLNTARDKVAKASQAYNDAIAQGMPAFLHNKTLAEISPEDLYKTYMGLTPTQRGTMRSWVGNTDQAALDVLDQQVFTNFVNQAKKPNALGVETVDLATLVKNWNELGNVPGARDALATSLGLNSTEFGQRMKDAELFTRKMSVAQQGEQPAIAPGTIRETQAAIGGVAGYSPAKIGQLAMDAFNSLTSKGLTDDQLMKVLLTPEGGQFLKSASLSPRSEKALTDLMATEQSNLGKFGSWLGGTAARVGPRLESAVQPTMEQTGPMQPSGQQDDLQLLLEEQARRQQQGQQ